MRRKKIGMNLDFAQPVVGLGIRYDGQRYDLIAVGDMLTWRSACKTCGRPFDCQSKMFVEWLTRNCEDHRSKTFAQKVAA